MIHDNSVVVNNPRTPFALEYAKKGIPVVPLGHEVQQPYPPYVSSDATTDPFKIKEMFDACPNALIGTVLGKKSGLATIVLGNKSKDSVSVEIELAFNRVLLNTDAPRVVHEDKPDVLFFKWTERFVFSNGVLADNVVTRGEGKVTLLPPGADYCGCEFTWRGPSILEQPPKRPPFFLDELIAEAEKPRRPVPRETEPVDLWAKFIPPTLPHDILPHVIDRFAREQGTLMGVDPGGLAVAALTVCSGALSDNHKLQVKQSDPEWLVSARIWSALVGDPSSKKSPLLSRAAGPLLDRDRALFRKYENEQRVFDQLTAGEQKSKSPPVPKRLRLEDATPEATAEALRTNPHGVLLFMDELSGFFGALDKYNSGKGSSKDRAFWLQAFNGGAYSVSV